ncbi:MAG: GxxExxY protein [Saprospiraceae bacterium]
MDDLVVVELKTVEHLLPVHQAQLLTYMKLLDKPQGYNKLLFCKYLKVIYSTCRQNHKQLP